jgi:hypothetical protein
MERVEARPVLVKGGPGHAVAQCDRGDGHALQPHLAGDLRGGRRDLVGGEAGARHGLASEAQAGVIHPSSSASAMKATGASEGRSGA